VVVASGFNAGSQVPLIPLLDVVGRTNVVSPTQIGPSWVNVGKVTGITSTVRPELVAAHWPVAGTNV
jgi:hypothetical protein